MTKFTVSDQENLLTLEVKDDLLKYNSALESFYVVAKEIRNNLGSNVKLVVKKDNKIHTQLTEYVN